MAGIDRIGRTTDGRLFWLPWRRRAAPVVIARPSINGPASVVVGATLIASDGAVAGTPEPTVVREWLRDGAVIPGAMGTAYATVGADFGKTITRRITASNRVGTITATSNGISVVSSEMHEMENIIDNQNFASWSGAPVTSNQINSDNTAEYDL